MTEIDYAFLHGGGQGGWVWGETIAALHRQTDGAFGRALALDIPGCGSKRGRSAEGVGPDEIAVELVADIEAAGLRDIVLVGHSQAGSMLPRLIARRPDLFRRVVYVSCLAPLAGETTLQAAKYEVTEDQLHEPSAHLDDLIERSRAKFCNDMTTEEAEAFLAKLGKDNWPLLTYTCTDWPYDGLDSVPASYFLCLRDAILPLARQQVFAERLGASRLVCFDSGHQLMNTRPHALAEALRSEAAFTGP